MSEDFVVLLKALLIEENNYTPEKADRIIKAHPDVVIQLIMRGTFALRATVMALEMRETRLNAKAGHQ